jgi:hypothetical protein
MAPSGSRKTLNCLDRSTSFVKDNLSIGRIAAGISPAGIIFRIRQTSAFNITPLARTAETGLAAFPVPDARKWRQT